VNGELENVREKILLVEDDPDYRALLRERLAPFVDITEATNLAHAIHLALGREYWCILLDLALPDSRWPDTVHNFSQITRAASIVIITARDEPEVVTESIRQGASGYLVKGKDDRDGEQLYSAICTAVLHKESALGLERAKSILTNTARLVKPPENNISNQ